MKFIERIKVKYPDPDLDWNTEWTNRQKAEKDLMATGKYALVYCGSYSHEKKMQVIDCLGVKPLTDSIRKKLNIKDAEQEKNILQVMRIYAIEPCEKILTPDEFVKQELKDEPAYPHAVSSVERNMYRAGTEAEMIQNCINPYDEKQTKKINKLIERNLARTPYTNWSGD